MGRLILTLTTMMGISLCCAFFSASCAAAVWRIGSPKMARVWGVLALLASSLHAGLLYAVTTGWERGPGYMPGLEVFALMAGSMAAGAALAIRNGNAREVLAATGWGSALGVALLILGIWKIHPGDFIWLAVVIAIVPAIAGLVLAPLLLQWRLTVAPNERSLGEAWNGLAGPPSTEVPAVPPRNTG
jgi:hypothetical protein